MNLIIYTPELIIYALGNLIFFSAVAMIVKDRGAGFFLTIIILDMIFIIALWIMLSLLKNWGWIPCIKIFGNALGGCIC